MAQGGHAGEGAVRDKIGASGTACASDVQEQDGASEDSVGEDGTHPEREGEV